MIAKLYYVGNGSFLLGVPARDLEPAQIADLAKGLNQTPEQLHARLLEEGYYTVTDPKAVAPVILDASDSEAVVHLDATPTNKTTKKASK